MKQATGHTGQILKALLASWVTIVFGTSMLIVAFAPIQQKTHFSNKLVNFLIQIWEVADEMGPAVKIAIILLFAIGIFSCRKFLANSNFIFASIISVLFAIVSVFLVLAFLPAEYSRGFGIGLTGTRFDERVIIFYLIGAFAGGLVFTYTYYRLLKKTSA